MDNSDLEAENYHPYYDAIPAYLETPNLSNNSSSDECSGQSMDQNWVNKLPTDIRNINHTPRWHDFIRKYQFKGKSFENIQIHSNCFKFSRPGSSENSHKDFDTEV